MRTLIKAKSNAHALKISEYFRKHGHRVDFDPTAFDEDYIYMGIYDGRYAAFMENSLGYANSKIIELPEETTMPRKVDVRDSDEDAWLEVILISKIEGNTSDPFLCVNAFYEQEFKAGEEFEWDAWSQMREIERTEMTIAEMEEFCSKAKGRRVTLKKVDK